jgi:hypothetical protein
MALSLRVIPGYQFGENEKLTQTKLNQLGRPTIELQGALSSSAIAPGSITSDKLSPGLITGLTPLNAATKDMLMYHSVDANGLRRTTIGQVLALSTPDLTAISAVKFNDFAWIIQAEGGLNKKATIGDTLREAINGQSELVNAVERPTSSVSPVDPLGDMVLLYDASAAAGSNQNRKGKVATVVRSVTDTLIADAPAFSGTLNRIDDELLIRRISGTAGAQQQRIKLGDVLSQAGGIKAWVNFDGSQTDVLFRVAFLKATETLSTRAMNDPRGALPTGLQAGDYIWTNEGRDIPGIEFYTPYFVHPASSTNLELYRTKQGALTRDQSQRVSLQVLDPNDDEYYFFMWPKGKAAPIRSGVNVSAVVRNNIAGHGNTGRYRVSFTTPLSSANYATLITAGKAFDSDNEGAYGWLDVDRSVPTTTYVDIGIADDEGENRDSGWINVLVIG